MYQHHQQSGGSGGGDSNQNGGGTNTNNGNRGGQQQPPQQQPQFGLAPPPHLTVAAVYGQQQQAAHQMYQQQQQQQSFYSTMAATLAAQQQQPLGHGSQQQQQPMFLPNIQLQLSQQQQQGVKRQLQVVEHQPHQQQQQQALEDKENLGPTAIKRRPAVDLLHFLEPSMPDEEEQQQQKPNVHGNGGVEEEADDEEDVDDEEEGSTKTSNGSSPEATQQQPQQQPTGAGAGQPQQSIYATPAAATANNYGMPPGFPHFPMMTPTPLAHSTPFGNAYAGVNAAALRNLQGLQALGYWTPNIMAGAPAFQQQISQNGSGGNGFLQQQSTPMPTTAMAMGYGGIVGGGGGGGSAVSQLPSLYEQQQLLNAYGSAAASAMGYGTPSALMARSQQQQQQQQMLGIYNTPVAAHQQALHSPMLNLNHSGVGAGAQMIGHDSGLGSDRKGDAGQQPKNESSSGGSSEESGLGAPPGHGGGGEHHEMAAALEPHFPPYRRYILYDGQKQLLDLEQIMFGKSVPARLSLLNSMKKYQVSLAEIHRRLSPPECLNTSYLSGILRRAKNKDGGQRLREDLSRYQCGIELQTGKRKSSQVTTFSTLCEREAIQLAEDFGKLAKDPQNGFPHRELAAEMNRRSVQASPEQRQQRMLGVRGTIELLTEAISLVQQATEQETLQLAMVPGELAAQLQLEEGNETEMLPQTLNQFKRFARLSHCFGNRTIVVCWQSLLEVFGELERQGTLMGSLDFGSLGPGTSQQQQQQPFLLRDDQANANLLLDKLMKQRQQQH